MCGLVGIVTDAQNGFATADAQIFKQLLYIDALRGEDSTGVIAYYNDGAMEIAKEATTAHEFLNEPTYAEINTALIARGKAALGHNRKKTSGLIKDSTAHPFIIDGEIQSQYAFVHNGTLTNYYQLKHKLPDILTEIGVEKYTIPDSDVDSETLATLLCRCDGDIGKMETVLGHVNGAYACMWIDQKKEILYLLRNAERPLFLGETSFGVLIGSEPGFIHAAAARNNTKIKSYEDVDVHTLYSFKLNQKSVTYKKEKLEVKKALPPVYGGTDTKNTGATDLTSWKEVASKNSMKRFRGKYTGKRVQFWITDCSLSGFPSSSRYLIKGECFEMENTQHIIRGYVDASNNVTPKDIEGTLMWGTISAVDYDAENEMLIISVADCIENVYQTSTSYC